MPYELARKNFKTAQRYAEREQTYILKELKTTTAAAASASQTGDATQTLSQLDNMINRMQGLKRKLETLHTEEANIQRATKTRIQHLDDLYGIPSLADVKYEEWSKVRLDRLLVDYLLRSGYGESAKALAKEKDIEELVDVDAFVQCEKIAESLRNGRCQEALSWCGDNKQGLKKLEVGHPGPGAFFETNAEARVTSNSSFVCNNMSRWSGAAIPRSSWKQPCMLENISLRITTPHSLSALQAFSPSLPIPLPNPTGYVIPERPLKDFLLTSPIVSLLSCSMGKARRPLRENASHTLFPSSAPTTPHRSHSRTLGT